MTRRILITGASSGIGRALALAYAHDRASLVLLGRDQDRLQQTAHQCLNAGAADVETHVAYVRDKEKMATLIVQADSRDAVDLVVANAGVASGLSPGQIMETPEAVRAMMAINVTGVFNTVEPIMSVMSARRHGQLAIVGSMAGVRALPYSPAYCAAKSAVHMWANCLRGALAPYNVHVSLIIPGFVKTPMSARTKSWQPSAITDTQAARLIKDGLAKRKDVIAFPFYMYLAMRFFSLLPAVIVDNVMRRFHVEVPETPERSEAL
jgi:short-subunit dehydrogenase